MAIKKYFGKLVVVDMYNCSAEPMADVEAAKAAVAEACKEFGVTCMQVIDYKDENTNAEEYSLAALCKQGHITLHIFPAMGFITCDIFSCENGADTEAMSRKLRKHFHADKSKITLVNRGDFGSDADMKPKRSSKVKFIRRTKNLGGKLKRMILRRH